MYESSIVSNQSEFIYTELSRVDIFMSILISDNILSLCEGDYSFSAKLKEMSIGSR
jgi:hypothetical protein